MRVIANNEVKAEGQASGQYEPPRLVPIGSARDLLAGAEGTQDDMFGVDPPQQPGGEG